MFKRLSLSALFLIIATYCHAGSFSMVQVGNSPAGSTTSSFTPAWQNLKLGGGGNLIFLTVYPDGTMLNGTDVQVPYIGNTLASSPWVRLLTTKTVTGITVPEGTIFPGTYAIAACAYDTNSSATLVGSTNTLYAVWNQQVLVSTNKGLNWTQTGQSVANSNPNAAPDLKYYIACDPQSSGQIAYIGQGSSAALKTVNGGTSFSTVSTSSIPAPTLANAGIIFAFDPTSTVTSNVTQGIFASSSGNGVYHSTNGGTSWSILNTTNMPTACYAMHVSKFGELWCLSGSNQIYKWVGGAWTVFSLPNNGNGYSSFAIDPNSSSTATEHITAVSVNGVYTDTHNGFASNALISANITAAGVTSTDVPWLATCISNACSSGQLDINTNDAGYDVSGNLWVSGGTGIWKAATPGLITTTASAGWSPGGTISVPSGLGIVAGQQAWDFSTAAALGTVQSYVGTTLTLVGGAAAGGTNGDTVQTYSPFSSYTAGIENLVITRVMSAPGLGPFTGQWDKGRFSNLNPDIYPSAQAPTNMPGGNATARTTDIAYAQSAPTTLVAADGQSNSGAISTNGGKTWTAFASGISTGNFGFGGTIAALSASDIIAVGFGGNLNCSINGGSSWTQVTLPGGTPASNWVQSVVTAAGANKTLDTDAGGFYYAYDDGVGLYTTTGSCSGTWSKVLTGSISTTALNSAGVLHTVPGVANNVWYSPGWVNAPPAAGSGGLYKSTNGNAGTVTFSQLANVADVSSFGFGAAKPGSDGYPTIYFWGYYNVGGVTWTLGLWQIVNADSGSPIFTNLSPNDYPNSDIQDYDISVSGDLNVYGRVYVGKQNQGADYYDTADACAWVKSSNTNPVDSFAIGTPVTLQATASGMPQASITAVNFYFDGVLIGTQTTPSSGLGTAASPYIYSQAWTPGGSAGSHTLSTSATNSNCPIVNQAYNSFSIPITTH